MSFDPIGDFLTIIRNGIAVSKSYVEAPYSIIKNEIARILKDEGFIKDYSIVDSGSGKKTLKIYLKYAKGESVIHELKRISKPGRRQYERADDIKHIIGKLGISILTTNKGLMTNKQAKELSVGGEVICSVW